MSYPWIAAYTYSPLVGDSTQPLSGAVAGSASYTASITGRGPIAGAVAGSTTITGSLTTQKVSGSISGTQTWTATLTGRSALAGSVEGSSAWSASFTTQHLIGSIASASSWTGSLSGTSPLTGSIASSSTWSAALATQRLTGSVAGSSTWAGSILGRGPLSGSSAGVGTWAGDLRDASHAGLDGSIEGSSTWTGTLTGRTALAGVIAGASSWAAALAGRGPISGSWAGTGSCAGALAPQHLTGSVAGSSTWAGAIRGTTYLIGSSTGVQTWTAVIRDQNDTGNLQGQVFGSSTWSGTLHQIGFYTWLWRTLAGDFASRVTLPVGFAKVHDNVKTMLSGASDAWVNPYFEETRTEFKQYSNRPIIRHYGVFVIDVYVRRGSGRKDAWDVVSAIQAAYKKLTLDDATVQRSIRFRTSTARKDETLKQWWAVSVRLGYEVDDTVLGAKNFGPTEAMTTQRIHELFIERFAAQLDIPYGTDDILFSPPSKSPFAVLTVRDSGEELEEFPATTSITGIAYAMLMFPQGSGTYFLYKIADDFYDSLKATRYKGVSFRAPSIARVGPSGDWWQITAKCPFTAVTS